MCKSKKLKTFISVSLAVVMVASVFVSAVASDKSNVHASGKVPKVESGSGTSQTKQLASESQMKKAAAALTGEAKEAKEAKEKDHYPVIIVPGINQSPTYVYDGDGYPVYTSNGEALGGSMFIISADEAKSNAFKMLAAPLAKMLITQKDNGFTDTVYEYACETFKYQATDIEGNYIQDLRTKVFDYPISQMEEKDREWFYRMLPVESLTDVIGEDKCFLFTFNLVGNILKSVDNLDEYIQMVKRTTGYDKVNLVNVSLGGTVFTGYIDKYGWSDINEVVNVVAALDGSDLIADLIERNFRLDDNFVYNQYIPLVMEEENKNRALGHLLNAAIRIMPKEVFQNTLTQAISGVLDTFILNCPQFWAMIPSDRYDTLAQRYLNDGNHEVLKAKTDEYHLAQLRFDDNISDGIESGVQINNIGGSNLAFGDVEYVFFSIMGSSLTTNSDGIISVDSTTMGTTGAAPGERLPAGYVQAKTYAPDPSYSYISPDGRVDTSTSVLPDNTWIFCGQHHEVGRNTIVLNLARDLLIDDELVDVHSKPDEWKQFNGSCNNNELRRYRLKEALMIDMSTLSPEDAAELQGAIDQALAQINSHEANQKEADAALERLTNILIKIGVRTAPEEKKSLSPLWETLGEILSKTLLKYYGANGFSDGPVRGIFSTAA